MHACGRVCGCKDASPDGKFGELCRLFWHELVTLFFRLPPLNLGAVCDFVPTLQLDSAVSVHSASLSAIQTLSAGPRWHSWERHGVVRLELMAILPALSD